MKKISIITPCRNVERYIAETVESVITQAAVTEGRVELEYIICDGNSTDRTVAIIESYSSPNIKVVSEPDGGMYDALAKGLRAATGDVIAYLNAGDYYSRYAFDIVLDLFEKKNVRWLTAYNMSYNDKSCLTGAELPYRYRRNLFNCGFYSNKRFLPLVQQESTFWDASLNGMLDFKKLASCRFAGDYYLWLQFSRECDLQIVKGYLGGFRRHTGQISENMDGYRREIADMTRRPGLFDYLVACVDFPVWHFCPAKLKKMLNPSGLFVYDHKRQEWG